MKFTIRNYKLSTFLGLLAIACLPVHAIPAYLQTNPNTFDTLSDSHRTPPQTEITQGQRIVTNNGNKRTFQSVVRRHMAELDKQTQNDLKILSYLETELNQIFSCYIRLSCPRIRSAKVLEECDELKNWPLYHQVMKMAGIRKYPYQNHAPQTRGSSSPAASPTTSVPSLTYSHYPVVEHHEPKNEGALPLGLSKNSVDTDGKPEYNEESYFQQDRRNSRRIRRGHRHHHNSLQSEQ